jgi:peptidoglycan/LPS O-acetylase OafA/YrhL
MNRLDDALVRPKLPAVDGLRAAAIILLVLGHYIDTWPALPVLGQVALPVSYSIVVLFVITGFTVTLMLTREFDATGRIAVSAFFERKVLRLYPTLLVFMGVTTAHHMLGGIDVPWQRIASVLGLVGNYYNALAANDATRHMVGHLWSIAVGAHALLFWPVLLGWSLRSGKEDVLLIGLVLVVGMVMALRTALAWLTEVPDAYLYNASETRVDAIAIGSALALGLRSERRRTAARQMTERPWLPLVVIALLVVSLSSGTLYTIGPGHTVNAVLTAALILFALAGTGRLPWRLLDAAPLSWVSRLGFALFVWHLYGITLDGALGALPMVVRVPLVLAATFVIAAIMFVALEWRFRGLADRMRPRPVRVG